MSILRSRCILADVVEIAQQFYQNATTEKLALLQLIRRNEDSRTAYTETVQKEMERQAQVSQVYSEAPFVAAGRESN